jgi:hypothetical protein
MNKKRLSLKKATLIILISLFAIYILQSLYLTLYISVLKNNKFEDVPYKENSFISEKFYNRLSFSPNDRGKPRETLKRIDVDYYRTILEYTKLGFGKAVYFGEFECQFRAIDKDGKDVSYGAETELYVELEFKNFRWVVTRVWETP